MIDLKRRDRMIEAFREMTSHTERLPGKSYGNCRTCGAMVEWITTVKGKKQSQIPNMGEPHIPHCGKNKWTLDKWGAVLKDYMQREEKEEARGPFMTIKGKTIKGDAARKILKQWESEPNTTTDAPW